MESGPLWIFTADVSISQGMRVLTKLRAHTHTHKHNTILNNLPFNQPNWVPRVPKYREFVFYRLNYKNKQQIDIYLHVYLREDFH